MDNQYRKVDCRECKGDNAPKYFFMKLKEPEKKLYCPICMDKGYTIQKHKTIKL